MSAMRWDWLNDVASPVVPQRFKPSQPLSSSHRHQPANRSRSGSRFGRTGVAAAAMTPLKCLFVMFRSEEHTSELQSLMRISYAVFCLKKKNKTYYTNSNYIHHNPVSSLIVILT